jgi:HSP20 family protein
VADNDRQNKSVQRSNASQPDKTGQPGGLQSRRDANRNQMARSYSSSWSGSPFDLIRRLNNEMDRWFGGGFGNLPSLSNLGGFEAVWAPNLEVFQRGDELVVRADLPGLGKNDVDVEVSDDALTIRGERKQQHEEEREGYYRSERSYGSFYRSIPLPEGAIADSAKASFENGVLEVTVQVPPAEVRRGRKLDIGEGHANQQKKGEQRQPQQTQPSGS